MLSIYFNYPNGLVTVHAEARCAFVRSNRKQGQRVVRIDRESLSTELQKVKQRQYKFASTAEQNDLWLQVDLADTELEMAIAKHVHRQLSKNYRPFAKASIESHC